MPAQQSARIDPTDGPDRLAPHEMMRLRAAADRVKCLYPGPVGEVLSRELTAHGEFGFRFATGTLIPRLVQHIMTTPLPGPDVT